MDKSVYTRPNAPKRIAVKNRRRQEAPTVAIVPVVAVSAYTECHVTPYDVAARMADYLDPVGHVVLEPQAGTGNLVTAALVRGCAGVVAVERSTELYNALRQRHHGITAHNVDFLGYTASPFSRIICNPPFSTIKRHIAHALELLAPGGVMVALVPVTFQSDAETLETLGADTFATAKVRTKIIRFCK